MNRNRFGRIWTAAALMLLALPTLFCTGDRAPSPRVALVAKAMDSEFWYSLREGAERAASEAGVRLSVLAPQREVYIHEQVNILEDQLVRGVDALIVAPAGVAQVVPVLDRAASAGVPVLIVDTDIDWPQKAAYVGTDNREGGRLAGRFIVDRLDGKGSVALIRGIPGVASQDHRVEGFLEVLEHAPAIDLAANQSANSERALAMNVMENILSANPHLDAVFVTSDEMALGVVEAIAAHGLQDRLIVVGFDAGREAVQAIQNHRIHAVVAQDPGLMGRLSVEAAVRLLNGETLEPFIDSGTELVTEGDVDDFIARREAGFRPASPSAPE
ncbi:MAG TPA: sugar ABC transporter substrate-binding protein [Acidobacteriota bacterium]|nr:sugar ABC transporter substrate-binding protein [Acidobacteriota bacterium]